ncbi:MAG: hypothetical protein ACI4TX_00630 [Christensenellales bacterium]
MKEKKKSVSIIIALLVVLLLSVNVVGFTLAKYATKFDDKNATATAAKWVPDAKFLNNDGTSEISGDIDLANTFATTYTGVKTNLIAPGTQGKFFAEIDATNVEVDMLYTIKLALKSIKREGTQITQTTLPTGMTINAGGSAVTGLTVGGEAKAITAENSMIKWDAAERTVKVQIDWAWAFGDGTNDANDTLYQGATFEFTVSIACEQAATTRA